MSENYLKVVSDTRVFYDRYLKRDRYYLLSQSRGKYIKLSKEQYIFLKLVLPYMNGTATKEQIEERIKSEHGISIVLDTVIKMLAQHFFLRIKKFLP